MAYETDADRAARYEKALEAIRDFGHVEGCTSHAPVYECGCYSMSQTQIASEALNGEVIAEIRYR